MIIYKKDIDSQIFDNSDAHIKVLRPKINEVLNLTDFNGNIYKIIVTDYDFKLGKGKYKILEKKFITNDSEYTIIQSKIDRTYLEKLVELLPLIRIKSLIIINADYSQTNSINIERLNLILKRSAEQCENPYLPNIIIEDNSLINFLKKFKDDFLILNQNSTNNTNDKIKNIVIGPEGGFSKDEITYFTEYNFKTYSLKTNILPSWIAGYTYFAKII
jgi:16S rRNA (uracil1498-N3)-methyltransferase